MKFAIIASVFVLAFAYVALLYAPTSEDSSLAASLTVNAYVDTTIDSAALAFGSLDPTTTNNPSSPAQVNLTNTANSNTAIDIYLNNTNMSTGANGVNISFTNLSVFTTNAPTIATNFNGTLYINGSSANTGFVENLAVNTVLPLLFWHDVPSGQTAGSYTAIVRVHSVGNGGSP